MIESIPNSRDTRIEVLNLANQYVDLQCFYVSGGDICNEIGFFISLSPYQPSSWLASTGFSDTATYSRVPPFFGEGEMKCAVLPQRPEVEFHNVLQARAIIFGSDGQTVGYSATAFRRLSDGDFTSVFSLDGADYEQCPDKLHFTLLGATAGVSESEMVLVPCTQDLLNQIPTQPNVQYTITNEFEQSFSAAITFKCFDRRTLLQISNTLGRATLGTDTAHVTVRGTSFPLIGLAIDRFTFGNPATPMTSANDPSFQGGRTATVIFP
ncbi:MAG: hypothetical protein HY699_01790 [Deltaproteobacteria bacterium]|nr:hypothetical protein [Deltaproteobacteria bacterium]